MGSTADVDSGAVKLDRARVPWWRDLGEPRRRRNGEASELRRASLDGRFRGFLHMAWPGSGGDDFDRAQLENVDDYIVVTPISSWTLQSDDNGPES